MMDKDRGYAWVILGASTILMCIGPSTYTTVGFLLSNVSVTPANFEWILNVFYIFWIISAFLAGCYAKQRPRQLATTGAALASIGLISSASTVKDASWFFLTFSISVGFGLGLSFHTAYLVVMSNFNEYKGLANGVCQFCIALGQLITPFLFTVVSMPRDRFQIKSLTTAVGFLTTLFFVVPNAPQERRRSSIVGDRNRRYSTVSRRSSQGEATVPLHAGFVASATNNIPINQVRTRRRSQYLLQVSSSLLPNIPEEPESIHSTNDTLNSTSSDSELSNNQSASPKSHLPVACHAFEANKQDSHDLVPNQGEQNKIKSETDTQGHANQVKSDAIAIVKQMVPQAQQQDKNNCHTPLRRLSEGCLPMLPASVGPLEQNVKAPENNNGHVRVSNTNRRPVAPRFRRFSESQLESSKKQAQLSQTQVGGNSPLVASKSVQDLQSSTSTLNLSNLPNSGRTNKDEEALKQKISAFKGESIIDLSLLRDFHFVNMSAFSSLCMVTVVNYPIILYAYIVQTGACWGGTAGRDCTQEANFALTIIYLVDLVSRLLFSYASDLGVMTRRTGFLLGCALAGVIIATTPIAHSTAPIYFLSVTYGFSMGLLTTCQHVMFIESFGFVKFPQAYAFLCVIKLLVTVVLGVFAVNPLSIYLYPIHPFDHKAGQRNTSSTYDPLGILQEVEDISTLNSGEAPSIVRLLVGLAIPSILCALAWITEDIYKATQRCSKSSTSKTQNSSFNSGGVSDVP